MIRPGGLHAQREAANDGMRRNAEFLQGGVKVRRGDRFLGADDWLDGASGADGAAVQFVEEEFEIVEILRAWLQENISQVGFYDRFDGRGDGRLGMNLEQHIVVVLGAMADQ